MAAQEFVKELLRRYYVGCEVAVPALAQREFGFGFESKIDYRHKAFASGREFNEFLRREAPLYASYSTARYSMPAARPMSRKGSLGTDLVFDLDKTYEAEHPEAHNAIACEKCLDRSKEDALRFLEEFLLNDFGFGKQDVSVNYSGSKGFHFHVRTEAVQQLSSFARKQLCDYAGAFEVSGGTLLESIGEGKAGVLRGPAGGDGGWRGKFHSVALEIARNAAQEELQKKGLTKKKAEAFVEKRDAIAGALAKGNWDYLPWLADFWRAIGDEVVRTHRVELDKPVTFDMARLIRIPGTIHGTTGLVAKPVDNLAKFEPLKDALAFTGRERQALVCDHDVSFDFGGQTLDVRAGARVELPLSAALLLYCKGVAKPA